MSKPNSFRSQRREEERREKDNENNERKFGDWRLERLERDGGRETLKVLNSFSTLNGVWRKDRRCSQTQGLDRNDRLKKEDQNDLAAP